MNRLGFVLKSTGTVHIKAPSRYEYHVIAPCGILRRVDDIDICTVDDCMNHVCRRCRRVLKANGEEL